MSDLPGDIRDSRPFLAAARAGETAALDALVTRHLSALHAFVRIELGPKLAAYESPSDIVQSACREVLADLDDVSYRGEGHFRHWLYTAAVRKIRDRGRFWQREKRDAARAADLGAGDVDEAPAVAFYSRLAAPSEMARAKEVMTAFESAIEQMPDEYRQVLVMHRVTGMTHAEIAAELGKSEAAVRKAYSRATARFLRRLEEERGQD